jgi:hypothetical protein
MSMQMCWLPSSNIEDEDSLILHLREQVFDPWLPYTMFPQHKASEYPMAAGSRGWSTYHRLRQAGWVLIPTSQAQYTFARPEVQRV